jgi:hypothetical protein
MEGCVTGPLRAVQIIHESLNQRIGVLAKLHSEQSTVAFKPCEGFGSVSLRQVYADEVGMGSFSEWLCSYGSQCGARGIA